MIFIAFPGAIVTKRFEKGILALVSAAFFVSCAAAPVDHSPAADSLSGHAANGYWRAEDDPGLIIGFEGGQFITSRAGSLSEVSTILEASENGLRLCRFGQEVFQPLERAGEYLFLRDPESIVIHRLRRLPQRPPSLSLEPLPLPAPKPLDEASVTAIERELARRLQIDQEQRRQRPNLPAQPPWIQAERESRIPAEDEGLSLALKTGENTRYLRTLVLDVGWIDARRFSFDASNAAFLLVQHSNDLPLMLAALPWLRADAEQSSLDWEPYALLFDRVQLSLGKRQRYGTQLRRTSGGFYEVFPVEDESRLDEIRRVAGLMPLAQYVKIFGQTEVRLSKACAP